ncbi:MAG: hypothetical protein AAFY11_00125 [Cyanobacteria bacterium J06641_5]
MQNRHITEAANSDRALIAVLAACTTFVVGYTAVRMSLRQDVAQSNSQSEVQQTVIPHEAALWSDLGQDFSQ